MRLSDVHPEVLRGVLDDCALSDADVHNVGATCSALRGVAKAALRRRWWKARAAWLFKLRHAAAKAAASALEPDNLRTDNEIEVIERTAGHSNGDWALFYACVHDDAPGARPGDALWRGIYISACINGHPAFCAVVYPASCTLVDGVVDADYSRVHVRVAPTLLPTDPEVGGAPVGPVFAAARFAFQRGVLETVARKAVVESVHLSPAWAVHHMRREYDCREYWRNTAVFARRDARLEARARLEAWWPGYTPKHGFDDPDFPDSGFDSDV